MKSSTVSAATDAIPAAQLAARKQFLLQAGLQALKPQSDTTWEQVKCVGYNPQRRRLEAVVDIKRSTGYNGGLCSPASREYVRFFVDFKDGSGFHDMGLASFKSANISDLPPGPQHPISYMVYLDIDDYQYRRFINCSQAVIPTVRAILSWNVVPPSNPNYIPHYGNRRDADIQLEKRWFLIATDVLDAAKLPGLKTLLKPELKIPLPDPEPISLKVLHETNLKAGVPEHRTFFSTIGAVIDSPMNFSQALTQFSLADLSALKIDVSKYVDLLNNLPNEQKADVTYEEVTCVGLNTDTDTLGAVVHVKKSTGYSGDLCHKGSMEHVAFWADWNNNGVFDQYLGTASFETHDISNIPANGLYYNVSLPVDVSKRLRACSNPNIIRVRAVLSWESLPSTTDPNQLNTWGNRIDALVQLRPGRSSGVYTVITYVGDADRALIDPTRHLFNYSGSPTSGNNRPWGGRINFRGIIDRNGFNGVIKYRISYKKDSEPVTSFKPVSQNETFRRWNSTLPWSPTNPGDAPQTADAAGWYIYDVNPAMHIFESDGGLLANLRSDGLGLTDDHYTIRFEYTDEFGFVHIGDEFSIVVCNQGMTVSPTANAAVDFTKDLDLVIDGGDCHSYDKADPMIDGHLRAVHPFFSSWTLEIQPTSHTHGAAPVPGSRSYSFVGDNGDANAVWHLNTGPLDPCGYAVSLRAETRVILNSNPGNFPQYGPKAVGFAKQA